MSDPYLTLRIREDADDAAVEAAYLEGIKRFPPDRDAQRFEAVRKAYETLRTQRARLAWDLFDTTPPRTVDILDRASPIGEPGRPDPGLFSALVRGDS